jgi:deoxycytidylate deaminase
MIEERVKLEALMSTCQKRVVVCALFDVDDRLVACESNRCSPDGGTCHRLNLVSVKDNYPSTSECNWQHAEIRAILAAQQPAIRAIVFGHSFPCPTCEAALQDFGVEQIEIRSDVALTGERQLGEQI